MKHLHTKGEWYSHFRKKQFDYTNIEEIDTARKRLA